MSKGIYLLRFKGTDKVYIGQSLNIEYRYRDHLNPANRSQKLSEAFILYGNPTLEILCEATDDELDDLEERMVLRARYISGRSWDDIYDQLNRSRSAAHRVHASALANLKVPTKVENKRD